MAFVGLAILLGLLGFCLWLIDIEDQL